MTKSHRSAGGSRRGLAIVVALAIGAVPVRAALAADESGASPNQTVQNLRKLYSDPHVQQLLAHTAGESPVMVHNPCPAARYRLGNGISVVRPIAFNSAGALTAGAWVQAIDEDGCGARRNLNVLILLKDPKNLEAGPLFPGSTRAEPLLQRDAFQYAMTTGFLAATAAGEAKTCKIAYVTNTTFLGQERTPAVAGKGLPWREVWRLAFCSKQAAVPMHFIPDATGTTISAGPNTAVKVEPLAAKPN